MLLTKRQRNDLFNMLVSARLDPIQWDLTVQETDATLIHDSTTSCLAMTTRLPINRESISYDPESVIYTVKRSIGDEKVIRDSSIIGWSHVIRIAKEWVPGVKAYIDIRDLWADLQRWREILANAGQEAVNNTPFSPDERLQIANRLDEVKRYLAKTYSLSSEQMSQVVDKLDEAKVATERIGRKDWMLLFLGVMFTLIITGIVPPEAVQQIFTMVLNNLAHLFSGGPKPLAL